jgi:hypothetical protein
MAYTPKVADLPWDVVDPGAHTDPELSVIIVTPDSYDTIRELVNALRAQTARRSMELVIVVPRGESLRADASDLQCFWNWRIVELGAMRTVAHAKSVGIHHASAPVVVLTEDHSLPEPKWAQALIDAHRSGWAAVGPAMENGNPKSLISWADFIIGYGQWFDPPAASEVESLPGHNSSYKLGVLLELGDRLESLLAAEQNLHQELRTRGYRLYLETGARTYHSNFTQIKRWVPYVCYSGRVYAAQRARSWSPFWRVVYSAGAWLIPLVRLKRLVSTVRRARPELLPSLYLPLTFALIIDAAGQWLGYTFGDGGVAGKLIDLEFHRTHSYALDSRVNHTTTEAQQRQ